MNYRKYLYLLVLASVFLGIYYTIPIQHSVDVALYLLAIVFISYLPYSIISESFPRRGEEEIRKEDVIVSNDLAHFREVVNKAIRGNSVAQREVEMRLINMVSLDLSLRYEIPPDRIRAEFGREGFLERYLGEVGGIVREMYRRRHDLQDSIPGERFRMEVEKVLEAIR